MFCAVPEIDLERHEFADCDPRTGKWRRPISKKAARAWCIFALLFLSALFAVRVGPTNEFLLVSMVAFGAGVFAAYWLKDVY